MNQIVKFVFPVIYGLTVVGCTGYEKALKSTDYKLKYEKALAYYAKGDYIRSAALFDQCAPVYRGASQADTVYFYQAMSYYNQRDYIMAGHYFQQFSKTYGGSPFVEQSDYMTAFCYYMQSPRPSLDQTATVQAVQQFQLFLIRYSDSDKRDKVKEYISELQNKLVEKSFMSAKLYFDLEDYKASIIALNNSLADYPESKYREEIMFMILKSSYQLAYKSVSSKQKERYQGAIDEYYSFLAEYPESKYLKEAQRYYRLAAKFLGGEIESEEYQN